MINNYIEELEVWKPVKYMYRFNSALEIINRFYFNSDSFFVSNRGRFKRGLITVIKNYDKVTQTYTMAQLLLYNV